MAISASYQEVGSSPTARSLPVYEFDASQNRFSYAMQDVRSALSRLNLVRTLIAISFLQRYHGVLRGAFWTILLTTGTACGLGLIYSRVLNADMHEYFPFVTIGIVVWGLISGLLNDGAGVFVGAANTFNETPIPKSLFVIRIVGMALVTFAFKLVVIVAVLAYSRNIPSVQDVLVALLGLLLLLWSAGWFALAWGTLAARFQDLIQTTSVGLTFAFFVTGVFWDPARLGEYTWIVHINPLYHYINIIRGPLLDGPGVGLSFAVAGACAAGATIFGALVFGYFARRISYWTA